MAVSGGAAALYITRHISFARSRQHASIHASPGPPWPLIIGRHQPEDTPAPTRTGSTRSTLETRPGATRAVPDDRASSRPMIAWRGLVSSRFSLPSPHVSPPAADPPTPALSRFLYTMCQSRADLTHFLPLPTAAPDLRLRMIKPKARFTFGSSGSAWRNPLGKAS